VVKAQRTLLSNAGSLAQVEDVGMTPLIAHVGVAADGTKVTLDSMISNVSKTGSEEIGPDMYQEQHRAAEHLTKSSELCNTSRVTVTHGMPATAMQMVCCCSCVPCC
jgi:hypothetical protein